MSTLIIRTLKTGVATFALSLALTTTAAAVDPYAKPDDSWISISGTVSAVGRDNFLLDYGEGMITVEMDDWDFFSETKGLIVGDNATVYGRVDDDLYETSSIEASSVYVENLNTYFYANDADEEDIVYNLTTVPLAVSWMDMTGTVTAVDDREFTLDNGIREIQVDTSEMPYNPMDDRGYQRISKGDRVTVSGEVDNDLFESRELMAESIVTLHKDRTKNAS